MGTCFTATVCARHGCVPWRPRADDGRSSNLSRTGLRPLRKVLADNSARCAKRHDDVRASRDSLIERYTCNRPDLPRAVVYHDSMAKALAPLLSENFSRVTYVLSHRLDPAFIMRASGHSHRRARRARNVRTNANANAQTGNSRAVTVTLERILSRGDDRSPLPDRHAAIEAVPEE